MSGTITFLLKSKIQAQKISNDLTIIFHKAIIQKIFFLK